MSEQQKQLTDDRIASLLGSIINSLIGDNEKISFKSGNKYVCEIRFTVQDEYIEINKTNISKLIAPEKSTFDKIEQIISEEQAITLCDKIWQAFHASNLRDTAPLKLALDVIARNITWSEPCPPN